MYSFVLNLLFETGSGAEATMDLAEGNLLLVRLAGPDTGGAAAAEVEAAVDVGAEADILPLAFGLDLTAAGVVAGVAAFSLPMPLLAVAGAAAVVAFFADAADALGLPDFFCGEEGAVGGGGDVGISLSSSLPLSPASEAPALMPCVFKNSINFAFGISPCSAMSQAITSGNEAFGFCNPRRARSCIGRNRFCKTCTDQIFHSPSLSDFQLMSEKRSMLSCSMCAFSLCA